MEIPEDVLLTITDPDGVTIEEIDLGGYDVSQASANRIGDNVVAAVARWMERRDV